MASSNFPNKTLYDPVRKKWVTSTPEEEIRQDLVQKMLNELGYPFSLLAIEKELVQLPHLQLTNKNEIPKRRADIIAFAKNIHSLYPLYPLLMIECKSVPLTPKFAQQVIGYNTSVKAPFVAIANKEEVLTGYYDTESGMYRFENGLPAYKDLLVKLR